MSREEHRIHDELLSAKRALEKETAEEKERRKRKEKRDLAMAILLAIGGIIATIFLKIWFAGVLIFTALLACCGYAGNMEWTVGVPKVKIRLVQVAILLIGVTLEPVLLYPYWREEKAALTEGDLLGGDQSFNDGRVRMIPPVEIGDSGTKIFQPPGSPPFWQPFEDADFHAEIGRKGPMISTVVRDGDGHIVATVEKNHWKTFPYCADKNYTDDSLEILDSSLHVVFQVKLFPGLVQVQGEWWDNQGSGKRIHKSKDGKGSVVEFLGPRRKYNDDLIQPVFRYPSSHHWQELLTPPSQPSQ